jgi:ubiquinone/menaquinone biosynthesis C-methylase UbiE
VPGYEAKVIDDDGHDSPSGTIGRLAVRGIGEKLPFPDATFDAVVSSLALHNIARRVSRLPSQIRIYRHGCA